MNVSTLELFNKKPLIIAGPCSAETEEQLMATSKALAASGKVDVIRAGIWKPRTRPGSFEGVGVPGLEWMKAVKEETGLPVTVEVANFRHVFEALKYKIDVLWIGARTTANPFSVQEIAEALKGTDATVFVKNPVNPDIDLWVGALERFHKSGITKLAAVHRGFGSYGKSKYRNDPHWQIPIELKRRLPELPIVCDPSHICGNRVCLPQIAQRAMDLDFAGLMIESHISPDEAWSDKNQQVTPTELESLLDALVLRTPEIQSEELSHTLASLRNEINEIDDELLHLLSSRMKVAENIGVYKRNNGITILQNERWNEIIEKANAVGSKIGLSEQFLERLLRAVHQESINHQNEVMNRSTVSKP